MNGAQRILREVLYPLQHQSATVILIWSVVFYLLFLVSALVYVAAQGVPVYLFGAAAWACLLNAYMEYCMEVLDRSAQGYRTPPAMRVELLGELRVLRQVLASVLVLALVVMLDEAQLESAAVLVVAAWVVLLPASLMMSATSASLANSLHPLVLLTLVVKIGPIYLATVVLLGTVAGLVYLMLSGLSQWVYPPILATAYLLVLLFRLLGNCLHLRRDALDLTVAWSPELEDAEQAAADARARDAILQKAYELSRGDRLLEAEQLLLTPLQKEPREVFTRVQSWPNKKLALLLSDAHLARLVDEKRYMQALEVCKWCLEHDPRYAPKSGLVLEQMAARCTSPDEIATATTLIENFAAEHPVHPSLPRLLACTENFRDGRIQP